MSENERGTTEESTDRICPLLAAAQIQHSGRWGDHYLETCNCDDDCKWFDRETKMCAVTRVAASLKVIAERLRVISGESFPLRTEIDQEGIEWEE